VSEKIEQIFFVERFSSAFQRAPPVPQDGERVFLCILNDRTPSWSIAAVC
jgi:hypothetical protein